MQTGDFDFDDYLLQVQSVKKMGGMQSMVKMIPGTASGRISAVSLHDLDSVLSAM